MVQVAIILMVATDIQMTALFEEDEDGGYVVTVPSLPGCVSHGRTIEEAQKNIQKAAKLHLSCMKAHSAKKNIPQKNIFAAILHLKTA